MRLVKIAQNQAADILAVALSSALRKHPLVAWFVPGGSNIPITVAALAQIPGDLTKKLILAQTDERYGPLGHPDSNWRQLLDAGARFGKARILPVLTEATESLSAAADRYDKVVHELLGTSYKIGQFGIGGDGHIAGIKPDTPASVATVLVVGYENDDFIRITLTFDAIEQLDEAYAFVFGAAKRATLEVLASDMRDLTSQPAQILKSVNQAFVYNDQIGEELEK